MSQILDRRALEDLITEARAGNLDRSDTFERHEVTLAPEVLDAIEGPDGPHLYVGDLDTYPEQGDLVSLGFADNDDTRRFLGIVTYADAEDSGSYRLQVCIVHADGRVSGRWGNSLVRIERLGSERPRERVLRPGYHPSRPRTHLASRIVGGES